MEQQQETFFLVPNFNLTLTKEYMTTLSTTLTPEIYENLRKEAGEHNISMSDLAAVKLNVKQEAIKALLETDKYKEQLEGVRSKKAVFRIPTVLKDALKEEADKLEISLAVLAFSKLVLDINDLDKVFLTK